MLLRPGDVIGILGGGQLGRMIALAAARLGLSCHIYAPEPEAPAFAVAASRTVAGWDDEPALRRFAASVACVTLEFENVPAAALGIIEQRAPVRPGVRALEICQDRVLEKRLAREVGAQTAEFAEVSAEEDIGPALSRVGLPAILKTRRFGYDGKGQAVIREVGEAAAAFAALGRAPSILEAFAPFALEVSVAAARAIDGAFRAYPVTENEHRGGILRRSLAPADVHPATARAAADTAERIARALDYVGVLAVEFFVMRDGAGERLLVNEIAPRVHNSGHWTLDGADTSQFEQHVRAIAGWPLGATTPRAPAVEMMNLIGEEADRWSAWLGEPGAQLHLYGKGEARPGRKMGHVTRLLRG